MANHQKFTAALLTGALLAAQTAPALAAGDLSGHWASEALSIWQEHGIIRGDDRPLRPVLQPLPEGPRRRDLPEGRLPAGPRGAGPDN